MPISTRNEPPRNSATLGEPASNGRMYSPEKEQIRAYEVVAFDLNKWETAVTVRVWSSRSNPNGSGTIWASIWAYGHRQLGAYMAADYYTAGHGKSSGYGYDKISAAVDAAIASAGIALATPIDGHGDQAIDDALRAIALACGHANITVVQL